MIDKQLILTFPTLYTPLDDGKNIIHICTRLKSYMIMEEIVEKFREVAIEDQMKRNNMSEKEAKRYAKAQVVEWMNQKTKCEFGYTPIHFACYHGQSDIIKILDKYGADMSLANNVGLTPMHIAAWNDLPYPLTYLYWRGADPDSPDHDGQTPLHWACYHGSDEALYFLLAWTKNVNSVDVNGQTPLHQAIEQIHRYAHYRPIKEMMIKGASRHMRDING